MYEQKKQLKRYFQCRCTEDQPCHGNLWEGVGGDFVRYSDIEPLIEVLRFYADRKNYSLDDYRGLSGEMSYRNILHGDMEEINDVASVAGRRAREALRKVGI